MKSSALLDVPYDKDCGIIRPDEIAALFPTAPLPVRELLSEHGRKHDFQTQYRSIEIGDLRWKRVTLDASEILQCSTYPDFDSWVNNVSSRLQHFEEEGWFCIDVRPDIVEHWRRNQTWVVPPIMLDGSVLGQVAALHLMEGHTRLGVLRGVVARGILQSGSRHEIWRGAF